MTFSLSDAHEFEPDACHAVLQHNGHSLRALLKVSYSEATTLPPKFAAEIDYTSIARFEVGLPRDDSSSGLFATEDPIVILADGTVCNHTEIGPDHVLIDVQIQDDAGLFTVTSEDLKGVVPEIGSRLRAWLISLTVYPTRT